MMAIGGMYNILREISERFSSGEEFDINDVEGVLDICVQSIRNNLTRLYRAGLLYREEKWIHEGMGKSRKIVTYRLTEQSIRFIRSIYGNDTGD